MEVLDEQNCVVLQAGEVLGRSRSDENRRERALGRARQETAESATPDVGLEAVGQRREEPQQVVVRLIRGEPHV